MIPDNGDEPYCKCEEGYLRQGGVCLHCFYKEEITLLKEGKALGPVVNFDSYSGYHICFIELRVLQCSSYDFF